MRKGLPWLLLFLSLQTTAQKDTFRAYFDFGISQLNESAMRSIDSLLYHQYLVAGKKVSVIGYADHIGGEASNLQLSETRALAVKQYLISSGFKAEDIQLVAGRGELKSDNQARDRKVEIITESFHIAAPKSPAKNDSELDLSKIKTNETIRLNNLQFWGGSYDLLPASMPTLEKLNKFLADNPKVKIRIEGHVCCTLKRIRGREDQDAEYIMLSTRRAKTVYDYLVSNGIDKTRLSYIGFGGTKPLIYPESNEREASINRRVEIRIIEK